MASKKELGTYDAFSKSIGALSVTPKAKRKMSPRGRKAFKEDLIFGLTPLTIGLGLATYFAFFSKPKSTTEVIVAK
jgi:hypothetical protein